jgi:hypothetical protein
MKSTKTYYSSQIRNTQSNSKANNFSSNNIFNKQIQKIVILLTNNDNDNSIKDKIIKEFNNLNILKKQLPNYNFVTELVLMTQLINIINNYININTDLYNQISNLEDAIDFAVKSQSNSNYITNTKILVQNTEINLEYLQYLIMFDIQESNGLFLENNLLIAKEVLRNNGNRLQYNF